MIKRRKGDSLCVFLSRQWANTEFEAEYDSHKGLIRHTDSKVVHPPCPSCMILASAGITRPQIVQSSRRRYS